MALLDGPFRARERARSVHKSLRFGLWRSPESVFAATNKTVRPNGRLHYETHSTNLTSGKGLILDRNAYCSFRTSAADSLAYCVAGGLIDRSTTIEFLSDLFTGNESDNQSDFWSFLACTILDLYPVDKMDLIRDGMREA